MKEFSLDGFEIMFNMQEAGMKVTIGKLPDGEYLALSCAIADFDDPNPRMITGVVFYLGQEIGALLNRTAEELYKYVLSCPFLTFEFQNEAMGREIDEAAKAVVH